MTFDDVHTSRGFRKWNTVLQWARVRKWERRKVLRTQFTLPNTGMLVDSLQTASHCLTQNEPEEQLESELTAEERGKQVAVTPSAVPSRPNANKSQKINSW